MAHATPGWHSAKVPSHLSLPLLRKPQTPLMEPHPYGCIQASFPPQGPASRYHRHTLFGDCVFNIGILGVHSQHPWFSGLQPPTSSAKLELPIPIEPQLISMKLNLQQRPSSLRQTTLCFFCTRYSCELYMLKKKPRKAEHRQLNHPFIISLHIACWLRLCFGI